MSELVEFADIQMITIPILLGLVAGAISMLVYARLSPQEKLQDLKSQASDLQQQLSSYDGDFSGAMTLAQQNLRLSFKRLGVAFGPSLLSGIPVLAAVPLIGEAYIAYFVAVAISALAVKQWRHIT